MLSSETESKIAGLFIQISSLELEIETSRYNLCKHKDFDPYATFHSLDHHNLSSLSPTEIQQFLDRFHFFCTPDEAFQLIRQYDSNLNGRLTFNEFLQLVLPSTNPGFRELALARRGYFTPEVEYLLAKLIQQEILYHRTIENIRHEIVTRPDFNLLEAFRLIDIKNSSFIDRETLLKFLNKFKILVEQDIDAIFRRIDNDGDKIISYLEFVDSVMPSKVKEKSSQPLRTANPLREFSNGSPRLSERLNDRTRSSPLRSSPVRQSSPLRQGSPPRHSSPLRKSPLRHVPERSFQNSYNHSSPAKEKPFSYSPSKSVTFSNALNVQKNFESSGFRRTSPLRLSPSKSFVNREELRAAERSEPVELRDIVQMFQEEIKTAKEIEPVKNNLALKHDFNLIDAFRMFDAQDKGAFTQMDLENALARLGLRTRNDEVYLLVKHFSRLQDCRLRFSDFSEMLTPKQEEYARIMRNKTAINIPGLDRFRVFARDTVAVIVNAFQLLFEAEVRAEQQRQRISRLPGFELYQVFNYLDKDKNGFVTFNEFQEVMNRYRVPVSGKELGVIMQKFDKNCDGRVSYSEFVEEITPKSVQLY